MVGPFEDSSEIADICSFNCVETGVFADGGVGGGACLRCCKESVLFNSGVNAGEVDNTGRKTMAIKIPPARRLIANATFTAGSFMIRPRIKLN